MNLIHPRVEVLDWLGQTPVMDRLEVCGRTAYKSEERIVVGSADKFVASILKRGHLSVLEHHRFVTLWTYSAHPVSTETERVTLMFDLLDLHENCEGLVTERIPQGALLSWNARTVIEGFRRGNGLAIAVYHLAASQWPTLFPNPQEKPLQGVYPLGIVTPEGVVKELGMKSAARLLPATLRFVCDRGISHELVRHRKMSPTQESTRYCDYGKHGVTFVIPPWVTCTAGAYDLDKDLRALTNLTQGLLQADDQWVTMVATSELQYRALRENGWTPQQARTALAHSVKTEVCVTGTLERWHTLLTLRVANDVHPQMAEVSVPALRWFQQQPVFGPYFADIQVGDKWRDLRVAKVLAGANEGQSA